MHKSHFENKLSRTWILFFSFMFVLFLDSFYVYFFWQVPYVIPIILAFFSVVFLMTKPQFFSFNRNNIVPFCLFFLAMLYSIREQNLNGIIAGCMPFISLFLMFNLKKYYKALFLETITTVLSLFLLISLLAWLLVVFGVSLPKSVISYVANGVKYDLNNYYFFIEYTFETNVYHRFMSIFIEPGYLGSLLAIMIYVNNFDFKRKSVLVLLISLIVTFSIAGYLMFIFSYLSFVFTNKRSKFLYSLIFILALLLSYNVILKVSNENSFLMELVVNRLQYNSKDAKLSGYNRTSEELDFNFAKFLSSDYVITGVGNNKLHNFGDGVGYKVYTISNGLVGLSLLLLAYFSGYVLNRNTFSFTIVVLYILMFYKGHSEIFWAGFLMFFSCSVYLPNNWRQIYKIQ